MPKTICQMVPFYKTTNRGNLKRGKLATFGRKSGSSRLQVCPTSVVYVIELSLCKTGNKYLRWSDLQPWRSFLSLWTKFKLELLQTPIGPNGGQNDLISWCSCTPNWEPRPVCTSFALLHSSLKATGMTMLRSDSEFDGHSRIYVRILIFST